MAKNEQNIWLERFDREIGFKSAIIVFGNTTDIILNDDRYDSVVDTLKSHLEKRGFDKVVKWDRVDGMEGNAPATGSATSATSEGNSSDYDLGEDIETDKSSATQKTCYKDPNEFFPYMLSTLKSNTSSRSHYAFILDYSDYIFGNANSLSDQERNYLATLGKVLERSQSYNMASENFDNIGNVVVIIAKNNAMLPPALYINNPMVSSISVPMPGRGERESFIDANLSCLKISQDISMDKVLKDDFIDALEGFSLKEIAQIIKLSSQMERDRLRTNEMLSRHRGSEILSFERLINLFKYGEKTSPWEELSKDKLAEIEERLEARVKGQKHAVKKVKDVIIRAYTGFSGVQHSAKQKKPKGVLFFVGPTGVGKTELAKALANFVFGDENACIRFDMSEYNHEHSDQRLVGAPPGYVGYEAGGQLTNAVREKPFCVLLFDEIEKAHGKILDKFLQILEDGRLTDGKGETVSFSESIIIFTSNIGAAEVSADLNPNDARNLFKEKVKSHFIDKLNRPELLNRIGDNIVPFNFIEDSSVFTQIAKVKFRVVEDLVKERYKATIEFENEAEAFEIIGRAAGKQNGGRGLLNVIETAIVDPLAKFIFNNTDSLTNRKIIIKIFSAEVVNKPKFEFDLV